MFSFGSPDSKFAHGMETFADAVWLTVLMLITSIPLITIGAAITAAHETARRIEQGEARITIAYFRAFASNFLKSTAIWLVMGTLLILILWSWIAVRIPPLLIPQFAISLIWLLIAEWVFALQARFENPIGKTFLNALIFSVSYWQATLGMLIVDALFVGLVAASVIYLPQGLPLLLFLGWGSLIMLHTPLLEHVFAKYIKKK
ncbi:YesL family protein [Gardnerella vaginalis]|uniref:YesL family protein n=1 Tax=Gardnerella vaginalis TaxID=2702 RepID=UPI0003546118|nr:YesL family protein [Gardnerella vaginalis]EPI41447.1 hypothetical protein HMPREF1585_01123 [Gardnerella vaginalis JCP8481B]EPI42557.1 hypothetical protein HMPREF1584_00924 [Gardnerella vaginalis JCP8481A]